MFAQCTTSLRRRTHIHARSGRQHVLVAVVSGKRNKSEYRGVFHAAYTQNKLTHRHYTIFCADGDSLLEGRYWLILHVFSRKLLRKFYKHGQVSALREPLTEKMNQWKLRSYMMSLLGLDLSSANASSSSQSSANPSVALSPWQLENAIAQTAARFLWLGMHDFHQYL